MWSQARCTCLGCCSSAWLAEWSFVVTPEQDRWKLAAALLALHGLAAQGYATAQVQHFLSERDKAAALFWRDIGDRLVRLTEAGTVH